MADGSQDLVATTEQSPRANGLASVRVVEDPIAIYDTARFEHYQRIASVMASSSLVPEHLKGKSQAEALANCFLVVNQADRWGMDPFAVAQATFVQQGKIGYEGKLIAAAIEKKLGIKLTHTFTGSGMERTITLSDDHGRSIVGDVKRWHTKNKQGGMNHMWMTQPDDMLIYRGTRQWCRRYEPGVILGVYSADEIEEMTAAFNARDITPAPSPVQAIAPPKGPPPAPPKGPPPAPKPEPAEKPADGDGQAVEPAQEQPAREAAEDETKAPITDVAAYLDHLDGEMASAQDEGSLNEVWTSHLETSDGRLSSEDERKAEALYDKHQQRVSGGSGA